MKRSGFLKRKTPLRAKTGFKRKTPLSKSRPLEGATRRKVKRTPSIDLPDWFRALRYGSHGSTPIQKKAWAYISDMVRQSDFRVYGGKCVSCPRMLARWEDGDCAHYIPWSVANGIMKFHVKNLALSCKWCNGMGGASIGHEFGEELKRRYGPDVLMELAVENAKYHATKLYDEDVLALVTYYHSME